MNRLRVGDDVIVTSGNDKDKRGKISKLLPKKGAVVVTGVNMVKRHVKPNQQRPGTIVEVEAPISASNVMLVDPETNKRTRVRIEVRDGEKVRVAKSGAVIPTANVAVQLDDAAEAASGDASNEEAAAG